ncbi:uncharacterized protein KY384_008271 [Bacidia gigantensis]|uniref:uncharacterized protein n=1 Tax=Bacidia gigantensis TaxID=2732470 RepID=UPI001D040579|nr:uncharacterized protein KY384_008271 [Bacidia gigantensis]KAG8526842.1 hypothetical protein KY384_008271 [Bacidia gigantensis]
MRSRNSLAFLRTETIIDEQEGEVTERREEASKFFHESLSCFQICLTKQEEQYTLTQQAFSSPVTSAASDENHEEQHLDEDTDAQDAQPDSWYSVEEPVTIETLLDTCKAQLETLKALCSVQSGSSRKEVRLIESSYLDYLEPKILKYSSNSEKEAEISVIRTAFVAALACARFRTSTTNLEVFEHEFNQAIGEVEHSPGLNADVQYLSIVADANIDFDAAVEERLLHSAIPSEGLETVNRLRWKHITKSLDEYTNASRLHRLPNLARIHLSRGDCELLRARLADEPFNYALASQSRTTLIQNAAVFYGAADKVMSNDLSDPEDMDDKIEVGVKLALVAGLQGRPEDLLALLQGKPLDTRQKLQSMKEQRLLSQKTWSSIEEILNPAVGF